MDKERELVERLRDYIAACSGPGITLYAGHPAVLMSEALSRIEEVERERDEVRDYLIDADATLEAAEAQLDRMRLALEVCIHPLNADEIGTVDWWREAHNCVLVARSALKGETP